MKCSIKGCDKKAEFARVGSEDAFCVAHAPLHIPPLHDLDELPVYGWNHIDAFQRCASCGRFQDEDKVYRCDVCPERSCYECMDDRGVCAGCRLTADLKGAASRG